MNNTTAPALFNDSAALWVPFFRAHPAANLTYCDGAVYVDGKCRAMFANNAAAMAAMTEAREQAGIK